MNGSYSLVTALVAFALTALSGFILIPYLRRLKFGQTILDIGPAWHKSKQGTPTMGGFMFIIGITAAAVIGYMTVIGQTDWAMQPESLLATAKYFVGLATALAFGFIGFMDDYVKVVKKRNLGLTASQKLLMQFLVAFVFLAGLYWAGDRSTVVFIPFMGQLDLGVFYYVLAVLGMVGFVNAVNFTDGIDGLAASVTFVVALSFVAVGILLRQWLTSAMALALAGGCLGFLVWNFHPAKVFMGDTGSLFLGGLVAALGFSAGIPVFLLFMGIIYICEIGSVVLQVISFKSTGKRIFKMSPIHHHYEMSGYSEVKIVFLFSLVTLVGCALAIWAVMGL